jgi:hypothetical protein
MAARALGATTDESVGGDDEGFGWVFGFAVGGVPHTLFLMSRPEREDWVGCVTRAWRWPAALIRSPHSGVTRAAVEVVHRALSAAPEVSALSWHQTRTFNRNDESQGAPAP